MRLRPFSTALLLGFGWLLAGAAGYAGCTMEKAATLPMQVDNGLIYVSGSINGRPVRFLVDTTADSLVLPNPAHDMELFETLDAHMRSFVYYSESGIGPANVEDLGIGELSLRNQLVHVIGRRDNFGAPDQIAVLGRDILHRYDVEIDAKHSRITFYTSTGCGTANLAAWDARASAVGMLAGDNRLYYHIIGFDRFITEMRGIFLPAKINGRDVVAILDSGSVQTSISTTAAKTLGVTLSGPGQLRTGDGYSVIFNRRLESWQAPVESLNIGTETLKPASLLVHRVEGADELSGISYTGTNLHGRPIYTADLILGADFILSHHVLIAYSQNKVYFTDESGPALNGGAPSGED